MAEEPQSPRPTWFQKTALSRFRVQISSKDHSLHVVNCCTNVGKIALNKWGCRHVRFQPHFSFLTRTTVSEPCQGHAVRIWTQALAIFIEVGVATAPCLTASTFMLAPHKFRVLCSFIHKVFVLTHTHTSPSND